MSYEPPLTLPAAMKIRVNDQVLRLERDEWDGNWTLATEERLPRLLTRIEDDNLETQLIAAIAKYSK